MSSFLVSVIGGLFGAWLLLRVEARYKKQHPFLAAAVGVVLALSGKEGLDRYADWHSDPRASVKFNDSKPGVIELRVINGEAIADSVELEFSVLGYVTAIENPFYSASHGPVYKAVIGYETAYAQNTIQIHVPQVAAKADVTFIVHYQPRPATAPRFSLIGLDRISYRYTWTHNGNSHEHQRCISKESGEEVKRSPVEVVGAIAVPGEMMAWAKSLGEPRWRQFD